MCYGSHMDTITQPFLTQNPAHPCPATCTQGTQVVPVAGNQDRAVSVFVVYHGRGHLTLAGEVTTTPVHMTMAQATAAQQAHAA